MPSRQLFAFPTLSMALLMLAGAAQAREKSLAFSSGKVGSETITLDAILRIKFAGRRAESASLDVCFPAKQIGSPVEHVVLPMRATANDRLASDGNKGDIGPAQLRFQERDDEVRLTGTIHRGTTTIAIAESGLAFTESSSDGGDDEPEDNAQNVVDTSSSNGISFETQPKYIGDVINALKTYPVSLDGQPLVPTCDVLRDDKATITLLVAPQRLDEVMNAVKKIPNVANIRKGNGSFDRSDAILIPKLEQPGGAPTKAILDQASKVIEKETGGKVTSSTEEAKTGVVSLVVLLPPEKMNTTSVNKEATIEALVEPAADVAGGYVLYWRLAKYRLSVPDSKFELAEVDAGGGGEEGEGGGLSDSATPWKSAMLRAFKGKLWDGDNNAWIAPK